MSWITSGFSMTEARIHAPTEVDWTAGERMACRPPPEMTVSEWADERRVLQPGTSRRPGPWRTDNAPYLRDIMNAYNDPDIRHLVICAGTQIGKTEVIYNILGQIIDLEPYSTLLVYPREDDAKTISRTRVQPMIQACPTLRDRIPAKADMFQTLEMHFPGMTLYLVGANSAAALAQKPCRNVLRDEIDKYPDLIGEDADPLSLSEARTKSFWDMRKIVDVSSPTLSHRGIWKQLQACDIVKEFKVSCPFCGAFQTLRFEQIKWETPKTLGSDAFRTARDSAYYECDSCQAKIDDGPKQAMLLSGKWEPTKPYEGAPQRVGFRVSSLYSPFLTWGAIAEEFLRRRAKMKEEGKIGPFQDFINGWLAEPWQETVESAKEVELRERIGQLPRGIAPGQTVALTCGIDMQKVGFYFTVWAWARSMESWMISHGYLVTWEELATQVFDTSYSVEGTDRKARIWRAGIDTGGGATDEGWSRTEESYHWLRANGRGIVWGTKGLSQNVSRQMIRHSILDKMPGAGGKPIPGRLVLWLIDTDQLKELFFWRLTQKAGDPCPIHFHAETGDDFLAHLMAEEKRRDRNMKEYWHRIRKENHFLDASLIAHACADPQWHPGIPNLAGIIERRAEESSRIVPQPQPQQPNPYTGNPDGNPYLGG